MSQSKQALRKRRSSPRRPVELELFPFLSVLACTVGSLILLIIVVSSQAVSDSSSVRIVARDADGSNAAKTPRYIETRAAGVIIYPSGELVPTPALQNSDTAFARLLNEIDPAREYIIVAIRPSGVEVFREVVRSQIEARSIDLGYEPVDENWEFVPTSPTQPQ